MSPRLAEVESLAAANAADIESLMARVAELELITAPDVPTIAVVSAADDPAGLDLDAIGVLDSYWIPQTAIDPAHNNTWDSDNPEDVERLVAWLDANVPNDYSGYLCSDWESHLKVLRTPTHPTYAAVLASNIDLIETIKEYRPSAHVGQYNVPLRNYWAQDEDWVAANESLLPLMEASDCLFPICYDFYADPEARPGTHANLVREALRIGGDIPVVPYVTHRYHPGTDVIGLRPIGQQEMMDLASSLAAVEVDGRRITAICFWAADAWYINTANKKKEDGSPSFGSFNGYDVIDTVREADMHLEPDVCCNGDVQAFQVERYGDVYDWLAEAVAGPFVSDN